MKIEMSGTEFARENTLKNQCFQSWKINNKLASYVGYSKLNATQILTTELCLFLRSNIDRYYIVSHKKTPWYYSMKKQKHANSSTKGTQVQGIVSFNLCMKVKYS